MVSNKYYNSCMFIIIKYYNIILNRIYFHGKRIRMIGSCVHAIVFHVNERETIIKLRFSQFQDERHYNPIFKILSLIFTIGSPFEVEILLNAIIIMV